MTTPRQSDPLKDLQSLADSKRPPARRDAPEEAAASPSKAVQPDAEKVHGRYRPYSFYPSRYPRDRRVRGRPATEAHYAPPDLYMRHSEPS